MDVRQLRYFGAIAELGSVSAAAHRLGVAQPSLSQHVKHLEEELGGRSGDVSARRRLYHQYRFDSRNSATTWPHVVQRIERRRESGIKIAVGRAGSAQDQSQLRCAGDGRNRYARSVYGCVPDTPKNRAKFVGTIPLGRLARPADVANACVFLASDDAEFLTGAVLPVDGGRTV